MFKQPKVPAPELKPLGVDTSRMATNEPAIPLPWAVGKNRIALRWISEAFNQKTTAITQRVGKRNQTTGYNIYCDIAGMICAGPVDRLLRIYIDGAVVWESLSAIRDVTHPNYYEGTVPNYGRFRIYWGTATQPKDTLILNYSAGSDITWDDNEQPWEFPNRSGTTNQSVTFSTSACPADHPAYLDQCYIVWSQLFCGQNRESVPNVEVEVWKAARFGTLDTEITDEGVNPVSAIAELLTNDLYGAGLPASVINSTQWSAVADVAARRKNFARYTDPTVVSVPFGFISPLVERQTTVRQLLTDLFLYFDGYVRARNGQLEVGCFPHDGVTPTGLTTLTLHDDTQLPEYQAGSWADTLSQVTVIHRDGDRQFNDNAETCSAPLALSISGQPRRESLQREHFITRWQGADYAQRWSQINAHPQNLVRGRIRVRKERAVDGSGNALLVGDRFNFAYTPYSISLVARITSRTDTFGGGDVELGFEAERGLFPVAYLGQGDDRPDVSQVAPTSVSNARVFQLPAAYLDDPAPAVVALVERPAGGTAGFHAFFSTSDSSYDLIGSSLNWSVRATLQTGISSGGTLLTINASGLDLAKLQPQSTAAQEDNALLLFIDTEVMSIGGVTALGGGQYSVSVLRGRYGSSPVTHSASAVIYIIARSEMLVLQHASFPRTASTRYFKFQTYTTNDEEDLASSLKVTFTFADRGVTAPTSLSAVAQTEGIYVSWVNPTDPDLAYIEIFERGASTPAPNATDSPQYTIAGNFFQRGGLTAATTKWYWIRAVDTISDKSAFVGPVFATAVALSGLKLVSLSASSSVFKVSKTGTPDISSITLTASGQNVSGSPSFSVTSGTATLTGSGTTRSLAYTDMVTSSASITVTWDSVSDTLTVVKLVDGADGSPAKALALAADSQVFQIAKDGSNSPSSITFTATGQNLTGSPVFTNPVGTATLAGTGSTRTLAYSGLTTDSAKIAVTWDGLDDAITVVKVREGTDSITALLTNESHNVTADAAGTVSSFAGASTTMKVFKGATDDTGNWSFSTSNTSLTTSQATNTFTATAMSADVGYADISATRTGYTTLTKRFTVTKSKAGNTGANGTNGTNGTNGARGSKQFYVSGTAWTDLVADTAITTAGLTKVLLDQVTISSSATGFSQMKYWDGSVWQVVTQVIDGNLLVNGSIGASKIAVTTLSALTANMGTLTSGSISVGTSTQNVSISSSGLTCAGSRISLAGDGTNPYVRIYGANGVGGNFSTYYAEMNGQSGAVPPFFQANGGTTFAQVAYNTIKLSGSGISYLIDNGTAAGKIDLTSNRFTVGSTTSSSIALITGNSDRFYIGSDGHLKSNGGDFRKAASDTWGPKMYDGAHTIEFRWNSGLQVRVDGGTGTEVVATIAFV